jgi:hypothetical protein
VLVRDEGLLVELKRWVAKEATDNGQVVDDSTLRDQAIYDRLELDIKFRSVATRLLQRYGYLMPSPNPESDLAKEKELVLKERARRLVQIESQEDALFAGGSPSKNARPRRGVLTGRKSSGGTRARASTGSVASHASRRISATLGPAG